MDALPLFIKRTLFVPLRADESFWCTLSFRLYELLVLEWYKAKGCIHPVNRQNLEKKKLRTTGQQFANVLFGLLGYILPSHQPVSSSLGFTFTITKH